MSYEKALREQRFFCVASLAAAHCATRVRIRALQRANCADCGSAARATLDVRVHAVMHAVQQAVFDETLQQLHSTC